VFDACLDNGDKTAKVKADFDEGRAAGVSGTPTFFIGGENGYKIVGAQSYAVFVEPIEKVLEGEMPAPPPEEGGSVGSFDSLVLEDGICEEDGKPIIRLFSTTWCPHCSWIKDTFDTYMMELVDEGKIVAYHWELDTADDTLTEEVETEVPASELEIYKTFNPRGSIPTFVFGCKYYRVGNAFESQDDLDAEKQDFENVINALIDEIDA
jgi:protein-disulfide isomerase